MGGASNCWHRGCPKLEDSRRDRNRRYSSATREEARHGLASPCAAHAEKAAISSPQPSDPVSDCMRLLVLGAAGVLLPVLVAGCSVLACRPLTVTVAQKEERARLDTVSRGIRTTETGRLEELRVPEVVREYWVRAQHGSWYPISAERFRAAEVGDSVELCR